MKNGGFARFGTEACLDLLQGGWLDMTPVMAPCHDSDTQFWHLVPVTLPARQLQLYALTSKAKGDGFCLTLDGSLVEHELHLTSCDTQISDNQLFQIKAEASAPENTTGQWHTLEPLLSIDRQQFDQMMLVVDTPPEGDGWPHINGIDFVGAGRSWGLFPEGQTGSVPAPSPDTAVQLAQMVGRWQSTTDTKEVIEFMSFGSGYLMISSYDGQVLSSDPAWFQQTCDGRTSIAPEGFLAVGDAAAPLCYAVTLEPSRLDLTYLPRGNTLTYQPAADLTQPAVTDRRCGWLSFAGPAPMTVELTDAERVWPLTTNGVEVAGLSTFGALRSDPSYAQDQGVRVTRYCGCLDMTHAGPNVQNVAKFQQKPLKACSGDKKLPK
ncbi:DUF4087 domain-containing protein [Donghicola mangrovi]|uniref:DUF4087 domain-containing protein n=1 Tax=Donghicola mangrovi TaxID=2729614 RepID=A0A850QES2_9RHOB|nr:DUF4087 domain-containing protein [Donghicola mangrovi]NVO24351.1 DUF4087 domain-containing protein [Donghicola mangrovi]